MSDRPRAIPTPIHDPVGAAVALAQVVDNWWEVMSTNPNDPSGIRAHMAIQYALDRYRDACSVQAELDDGENW